jgi:Precorrin-6B methylase 2
MTAFYAAHRRDDVRQLALRLAGDKSIDRTFMLNQIAGWQTACSKLPSWATHDDIVYGPHLALEQCSSEATARHKATLVVGDELVDLTGGLGVDFSFMAKNCRKATYVERKPELCRIAAHNFEVLGLTNVQVVNGDGVEHLRAMPPTGTIFLDPSRRDTHGARVVALQQCEPDLTTLATLLLEKAQRVIVKLSPMLDWHKALDELPCVRQIHLVGTDAECKELLLVMEGNGNDSVQMHCVNDEGDFAYDLHEGVPPSPLWHGDLDSTTPTYLYEPHATVMKAGCFDLLAARFNAAQVARDSHLFVANEWHPAFPGRKFVLTGCCTLSKQDVKKQLNGMQRANVAVRNFPMSAPQLAKRLHLGDGGDYYIFGTTLATGQHVLLIGRKH